MAVSAKFLADFTSFHGAVQKARVELKSFETGAANVERQLGRMTDQFSGRRILSEATLAVRAVEEIGGAAKLTTAEQARVNAMVSEAIEKYRALGQTAPRELLELERATRRVRDAQRDFGTTTVDSAKFFNERTRQSAEGLGLVGAAARSLGPVLIGAFTVQKVTQFAGDIVEAGDRLQDMKEATGVSVRALQEFEIIADKSGTTVEALAKNAEQLGIRLNKGDASAVRGVKDLGLNLQELLAMRPEDRFTVIMDALGGIDDEARRAALGTALMGKGFTEVAGAASDSFSAMRETARSSMRGLSDEQAKVLADVNDAWNHFTGRIVRGSQITAAEVVKAFTLPAGWFSDAIGAKEGEEALERLRNMARDAEEETRKLAGKAPRDTVSAYDELTKSVAAAHREFRALSESDEQRIRNSILLGKSVEDLAREYGVTKRAIEFVVEADKLKAKQDEINARTTKERAEAQKRLNDELQKQTTTARDELFGNDAIKRAEQYAKAVGDVHFVQNLSTDSQAKLASVMRDGLEALILQGRGTSELTSIFESFRLKATETARDSVAAFQLRQAQAQIAAEADREMARAMEENRRAIDDIIGAGTSLANTQAPQLTMLAGKWHTLGLSAAAAIKLMVPPGFSFEQAYRDAGFIVHNPIGGLRPMAEGGIVTGPTRALIGEAGPEAVVPLDRGWMGQQIAVHIDARDSMFDTPAGVQRLADRVGHTILSRLRASGIPIRY